MPNMVENTSSAEVTMAATMSAFEMVSGSETLDMALENLHQLFFDLICVERLAHVARRTHFESFQNLGLAPFRTHHDDGEIGPRLARPQVAQQFQPVHVGHIDIQQSQADRLRLQKL